MTSIGAVCVRCQSRLCRPVPMTPRKEPRPRVQLTGTDGNAFAVIGAVRKALRQAGASPEHVARFMSQAMSGDYDHLLRTAMSFADVR